MRGPVMHAMGSALQWMSNSWLQVRNTDARNRLDMHAMDLTHHLRGLITHGCRYARCSKYWGGQTEMQTAA
eukprot:scaffold88893_cov20-Tisochrysis_lutea.AAC.3